MLHLTKKDNSNPTLISELTSGLYYLYNSSSNDSSFIHLSRAVSLATEGGDIYLLKLSLWALLNLYKTEIILSSEDYLEYMQQFKKTASSPYDSAWMHLFEIDYITKAPYIEHDSIYLNAFNDLREKFKHYDYNEKIQAHYQFNEGIFYRYRQNRHLAKMAYSSAIKYCGKHTFLKYIKFSSFLHLTQLEALDGNEALSREYLDSAARLWDKADSLRSAFIFNRFAAYYYFEKAKVYDSAYYVLRKSNDIEPLLDFRNNTLKMTEMQVKLQTAEKEKQILEEQQKAQITRNWLVVAIVALVLGTGMAVLLQKNTAKKRQLAEQEVLLKQQRVENLLKAQELASVDAMIAGQEKERQEVANELHDDLGGLMASIKLHFNSFKSEPNQATNKLYEKTESLIDEAYQKIRAIAHAKNSGVIAKHGLLKSINEMAQKVSIANNLAINVNDHGLDDRLENTMELTLFRVIQELITNIVKHSNASEANIHLTKHSDYLNIMIEDNGDGFDTAGITTRSQGMGLKSVDKRISHLGGSMNIDSEIGRGTTIIIEVPT
ncbi:sensor histidine kinase [Fulvivirga sp.]|uniref:sensor histidine kinase n=1 Tax=Fulvivirga sp. TaxID=1931237 RepID=UPI0032EC46B5